MTLPSNAARAPQPHASLFNLGQPIDTPAEQFAGWLPYSAYLLTENIFVNRDSMGFMLELMPQSGADDRMAEVLVSLYANCPPGTGIQFHLFASPHVRAQLRQYANLRVEDEDQAEKAQQWGRPARNDNLFRKLARQRVGHLLQGAQQSLTAGFHYTVRDFRLMLSVAFAGDAEDLNQRDALMALRDSMASTLRSASLPNRVCDAADLITDINEDIDMLVPGISKMASMQHVLEEVQYKAISAMVLKLFRQYGNDLRITALRDAFKTGTLEELGVVNDQRIKDLAIMLNPYARGGQYERFFEGRNNVDFSNDFIVIENEELKRRPDLHAVVNILLLHQITGEMYLTRNRRKVLFIDELKQQLGDVGADDPVKAAVIEEAARRARKYGGALGTATQSADDFYGSAQMEAAFNCSDWVFLLRQKPESIEMLDRKGRLAMDEPKKRLLNSLRTEAGVFSELYISSPVGEGVARNILDPATHLLFSNKLEDNAPIDELRAQGLSVDEAISELLRRRGHGV